MKPPFGGAEHVLAYLASYTHRMAISNARITAFDGERVTFSYRDYKDNDARKSMTLDAVTFLGRFIQHVVPPRFVRIRYYGFLANHQRAAKLAEARALIAAAQQQPVVDQSPEQLPREPSTDSALDLAVVPPQTPARRCPQCGIGTLVLVARIDPERPRTWFDTS